MSGIFGAYLKDKVNIEKDSLFCMGSSMQHRAIDGINYWTESFIGFGNCQFNTTPESVGKSQPHFDNVKKLVITADARVDDRLTLAKKLDIVPLLKEGISDHELILYAYEKWNAECVQHLIGDFAFAIWDMKQQQLFCARDHLGVKPFYYFLSEDIFVFASEADAIHHDVRVPKELNEARIADCLFEELEGIDKTSTFFQSVHRLPPASTLVLDTNGITQQEYWQPDATKQTTYVHDAEYVEAFNEIFKNAMQDRLRTEGGVTSMLSGGIDSSYVVGTARKLLAEGNKPLLATYSGISENDETCRETYFINSVISQGGLDATVVSPADTADYDKELIGTSETCKDVFDSGMVFRKLLYLQARNDGHRVMLDGVEGDMIYSLSDSYPANLFYKGQWLKALSECLGLWRNTYQKKISLLKVFNGSTRAAMVPDFIRNFRRKLTSKRNVSLRIENALIDKTFAERININERLVKLSKHSELDFRADLREKHSQIIQHPSLTVALERYDRVAAVCGIEPRHPLLDIRLVEFSLSLPWQMKVRNGWSKYILRKACESVVPNEVAWRQGWEDIGWSFTESMINRNARYFLQYVKKNTDLISEYIDQDMLGSLMEKEMKTREDVNFQEEIWSFFNIIRWLSFQFQRTVCK